MGGSSWMLRKQKMCQEMVEHWNMWLKSRETSDLGVINNSARLSPGWGGWVLIVVLRAGNWSKHLQRSFPTNISMFWVLPDVWQDKPHAGSLFTWMKIWGQTELVNPAVLFCWRKKGGKKVTSIFYFWWKQNDILFRSASPSLQK